MKGMTAIERLQYFTIIALFFLNIGVLGAVVLQINRGEVTRQIIIQNQETLEANQKALKENQRNIIELISED